MFKKYQRVSLGFAWKDYFSCRRLKPRSVQNAQRLINSGFKDWLSLDLKSITEDMVEERHRNLSAKTPTLANNAFRLLRTIFNFAIYRYKSLAFAPRFNPVLRLSQLRLWNVDRTKKNYIKPHQMPTFVWSVYTHPNVTFRDYLLTILLTGFRHMEAASMKWENVDIDRGFITVLDTKNGSDHSLPMCNFLWDLIRDRYQTRQGEFVFEGRRSGKHFSSPYKAIDLLCKQMGFRFTPHDLRRTWLYIAERSGINYRTCQKVLNHSFQDVTSNHYSIHDPEELRPAMESVSQKVKSYFETYEPCIGLPSGVDSISIVESPEFLSEHSFKNSRTRLSSVEQIMVEARILLAMKNGANTKKAFYQKIGGQFSVNRIELERVLTELEQRGIIEKRFNEKDMRGFSYHCHSGFHH